MPAHRVLRPPPLFEGAETILRRVYLPIELRREVIDPPLTQPFARIGERLAEGVESVDALRIAWTPYAERTDTHRHPGLCDVHALIELGNEVVDVVPPPIVPIRPLLAASVLEPRRMVWEVELV